MNTNYNIRIRFTKLGTLKFISHLDLNRAMQRAIRRAELPIAYSEGFNPRPKLVFGLNVSVGAQSECEILDIALYDVMPLEVIKQKLNAVCPDGMTIYDVYEHDMPLKTIAFAEYEINVPSFAYLAECAREAFKGELVVSKRTKSSEAMTDISKNIKEIEFKCIDDDLVIKAILTAGNSDYLNPEYVIKILSEKCGKSISDSNYQIVRKCIYNAQKEVFN